MDIEDTIVAISSPPGAAERGIVRLSGPRSIEIAGDLFAAADGRSLKEAIAPAYVEGRIRPGYGDVPAAVYLFRGPRSYTRQDVVEIHTLGSPGWLGLLLDAALKSGARRAEPGEFTARAFLAGAFDLSQVHGIAGMIAARSDLQLKAAGRLMEGALSRVASSAREELAELLSLVEGALDFADEPIEFITPGELRGRLACVHDRLRATAAAGLRAERWGALPRVVLCGAPNVGKSSLLNRLSGTERAIAAPLPGTTRDVLSAPLVVGELECELLDVAGSETGIDEIGIQAQAGARRAARDADLLLLVVDVARPERFDEGLEAVAGSGIRVIVVGNKVDLVSSAGRAELEGNLGRIHSFPVCLTSSVTGEGCDELRQRIEELLGDRSHDANDAVIALMADHRAALRSAIEAVGRALDLAAHSGESLADADLVASELHLAADALGALVGKDQTEDVLGRIFSRFCVGK